MRILALVSIIATVTLFPACGSNEPGGDPDAAGTAAGPAISVEEALAADTGEALLVSGNLLVEDGETRLCGALAESFPPQCVGAALRVVGLDLAEVDDLVTESGVSWSDRPLELLGVVRDGVLTVSQNGTA